MRLSLPELIGSMAIAIECLKGKFATNGDMQEDKFAAKLPLFWLFATFFEENVFKGRG